MYPPIISIGNPCLQCSSSWTITRIAPTISMLIIDRNGTACSAIPGIPCNERMPPMHPGESSSSLMRLTQPLRSMPDRRAALLIAGVALAAALAARLAWPFDGLYGQDAFAYFRYARALWPWLLRGEPLPIYYWPAGYPLLVALALPLAGWGSAAGQAVSILAGAGAAGLTYLLSRALLPDAPGDRLAAWVGGLAVALSGAVLRANLTVMSDALAMACCAAALWAMARYTRTWYWPWLAGAAVALAWAIITRWICGLLAIPTLGFLILDRRHPIAQPE